ncbi:MAG: PD-(D/E)XK nuclease family protein [Candidatus Cloacimonetes bacterium]|nr:PD-(D/E)XK nuclease family protein [Candidatus Cloacimonadota bacterium]
MLRHFVPLCDNLFSALWRLRPDDKTLIVTPNTSAAHAAARQWQRVCTGTHPTFLSLVQLKERLLTPDSPLLPPFLRVHVLDGLLDDTLRSRFHIYGESGLQRFADRFFWLFESFREQRVSPRIDWGMLAHAVVETVDWKRETWEALLGLRRSYAQELERLRLTDLCLLPDTPDFAGISWSRCLLVNLVAATPLERELLRRLEDVCTLEAVYQMPVQWLDGDSLRVEPLAHPPRARTKRLEVVRVPDETTLVTALLQRLDTEMQVTVIDDSFDQRPWSGCLNPALLSPLRGASLRHTPVYRLLSDLAALAAGREQVEGEWLLPAMLVEQALGGPVGKAWLGDDAVPAWRRVNKLRERRFYLRDSLPDVAGASKLAAFVRKLARDMSWRDLRNWLWELPVPPESQTGREWEQYFSTLASFEAATERMGRLAPALVLLQRLVSLLGAVRPGSAQDPAAPWQLLRLADGLAAPAASTVTLLDLVEGRIPAQAPPRLLFSQQEALRLGFDDIEVTRQWQRYAFWRMICQSERAVLVVRENIDENVMPSGLVEEAILWARQQGIELSDESVSPQGLSLRGLGKVLHGREAPFAGRRSDELHLPFEPTRDGGAEARRLSPSALAATSANPASFFLRTCIGLRRREPLTSLDARLSGTIIHTVIERLIRDTAPERILSLLSDEAALLRALQATAEFIWRPGEKDSYHLVAPAGFERVFFDSVLLPFALAGAAALLAQLAADWLAEGAPRLQAEQAAELMLSEGLPFPLLLHGRVDLLVQTAAGRWLVDVKTGKATDPPFAQLRCYEALFAGDEAVTSRFAYVLWRQLLRPDNRDHPLEEILRELFAAVSEEGAWSPPKTARTYDEFAPLYRLDLRQRDEESGK